MSRQVGILLLPPLVLQAQALPASLTGRIVISGIAFAEGPAFDSRGFYAADFNSHRLFRVSPAGK
ncbi:exported hypothetical protein [Candidatus Sulfopaludibacter sp. SbA3]|nr:exported hypothetical protein [Candidatus Sulfopaludibacter sp. SbA3]